MYNEAYAMYIKKKLNSEIKKGAWSQDINLKYPWFIIENL